MGLQTAQGYNLTPDTVGAIGRGIGAVQGIRQNNQNLALGEQRLALGNQKSQLLEQANQQELKKQAMQGAAHAVVRSLNLPDDASRVSYWTDRVAELKSQNKNASDSEQILQLYKTGQADKANQLQQGFAKTAIETGLIAKPAGQMTDYQKQSLALAKKKQEMDAGLTREKIAASEAERASTSSTTTQQVKGLESLISGLTPETGNKALSAYQLSGGGDKGVKALMKVIESGTESEQRAAAPELLKSRFPKADPEEMAQLQSVIATSKTAESGFKEAAKLRVKQRQVKDFGRYKQKAIDLIDGLIGNEALGIAENSEWEDVVGSWEGQEKADSWFSTWGDNEANAVADIEEIGSILTGDNLKMMSGVLSESDIKLLKNLSGGALNRTRSDDRFKSDMLQLRDSLAKVNSSAISETPKGMTDNGDGTFTLPDGQIVRRK